MFKKLDHAKHCFHWYALRQISNKMTDENMNVNPLL